MMRFGQNLILKHCAEKYKNMMSDIRTVEQDLKRLTDETANKQPQNIEQLENAKKDLNKKTQSDSQIQAVSLR